jgi:hypothetical protein
MAGSRTGLRNHGGTWRGNGRFANRGDGIIGERGGCIGPVRAPDYGIMASQCANYQLPITNYQSPIAPHPSAFSVSSVDVRFSRPLIPDP